MIYLSIQFQHKKTLNSKGGEDMLYLGDDDKDGGSEDDSPSSEQESTSDSDGLSDTDPDPNDE